MGQHLNFYNECMSNGLIMTHEGLCTCAEDNIISEQILDNYFLPTLEEMDQLHVDDFSRTYWGSGLPNAEWACYKFTPLRQTIVLFMAAINNEL